ncbi:uncharacterized protein MELLADRAFT_110370 [Melampsora larici-populina 98AG31]|uniref:Uncharacterized protein n=1 Tax=Melampsora larici-populina (strain 98AG31 / pathotype 3-4-7) TaxID=747676 RepID=F4RZK4_MELLP|nr:uncharacterized protein MELLADRAFT_110370 [Melampsora larici-populina 98AG31]EGG02175.1 hypothetical protein MELLADRAFT_110370 [Melampsora larici-populina 98AG31]
MIKIPLATITMNSLGSLHPYLGLGQFDPAHQASDHSGSETDEPITQSQASTSMTAKIRGKKPAGRIRPNTKAKLAASLDSSVDSLKNQASEAIKRERIRAQSIIDHDNAKVTILETAARLDQKLLIIKSSKAPSQPEAMALFTLSYKEHFSDVMAATSAIQLFENEDKCTTFINSPPELRWTWLAIALGYTVVNE